LAPRKGLTMDDDVKLKARADKLAARLLAIHRRMEWIADEEARSAWVRGLAAQGHFLDEKERLIDETDRILDDLMKKHE
jgi:hypothetical protein